MNEYSGRYPWGDKDPAIWLAINEKLEKLGFDDKELAYLSGLHDVHTLYVLKGIAKREKKQKEEFKFKPGDIVIPKPGYRWRIPHNNILRVHSLIPSAETTDKNKGYVLEKVDSDALYHTFETYDENYLETFHDLVFRVATVANVCSDENGSCADCPYSEKSRPCDKITADDRNIIETYLMLIESGVIKKE